MQLQPDLGAIASARLGRNSCSTNHPGPRNQAKIERHLQDYLISGDRTLMRVPGHTGVAGNEEAGYESNEEADRRASLEVYLGR